MKPNTHRHPMPVYRALGFAGVSACIKSHESAAFRESTGPIFQVPLNPTYVVKSVLCRVPSVRGTSALRLKETFSVRVMFNRTHVILTEVRNAGNCIIQGQFRISRSQRSSNRFSAISHQRSAVSPVGATCLYFRLNRGLHGF